MIALSLSVNKHSLIILIIFLGILLAHASITNPEMIGEIIIKKICMIYSTYGFIFISVRRNFKAPIRTEALLGANYGKFEGILHCAPHF